MIPGAKLFVILVDMMGMAQSCLMLWKFQAFRSLRLTKIYCVQLENGYQYENTVRIVMQLGRTKNKL